MTTQSVWDDPELRSGGEFVTFTDVGDSISGTVTGVRTHRFDDGKIVPQILLATDDGEERTVTAGQVRLKAELADLRPEAGDHLSIKLTEVEKRAGGKTLKIFDVKVVKAGAATVPPVVPYAASSTGPAAIDPQAAAAALANLTPEQKKALGIA